MINGISFTQASEIITYTVTGIDSLGIFGSDEVDVTVNALPFVNGGPEQYICTGQSVTLSGSGANIYDWDNGVINGVQFIPSIGSLVYTVTGTDANGCVNTDHVTVVVNQLPVVTLNAFPNDTVCNTDSICAITSWKTNRRSLLWRYFAWKHNPYNRHLY